jgi:hypothetical protein
VFTATFRAPSEKTVCAITTRLYVINVRVNLPEWRRVNGKQLTCSFYHKSESNCCTFSWGRRSVNVNGLVMDKVLINAPVERNEYTRLIILVPVTVAEWSKTCIVFARSDAGIVGSNPFSGTDVWWVCLFCVCVVLCWSPVQGILINVTSRNWSETNVSRILCTPEEAIEDKKLKLYENK